MYVCAARERVRSLRRAECITLFELCVTSHLPATIRVRLPRRHGSIPPITAHHAHETSTAERIDIILSTRRIYKLLREFPGNLEINSPNLKSHQRRCDIKLACRCLPGIRSVYLGTDIPIDNHRYSLDVETHVT